MAKPKKLVAGLFGVSFVKDDKLKSGKQSYKETIVYVDVQGLAENPEAYGYKLYAENVPAAWDDLEPGSIVVMDYDGKRGKWLNGNFYVRKEE